MPQEGAKRRLSEREIECEIALSRSLPRLRVQRLSHSHTLTHTRVIASSSSSSSSSYTSMAEQVHKKGWLLRKVGDSWNRYFVVQELLKMYFFANENDTVRAMPSSALETRAH